MKNALYEEYCYAKNNNDFNTIERLYLENKEESVIANCYAKMLIKKRRNIEAEKILLEVLEKEQNNTQTLFTLGKIEIFRKNYDKARMYFLRVIDLREDTYALSELGKVEAICGNYEDAYEYFGRALNYVENAFLLKEYARVEVKLGKINEAREDYIKSLKMKYDYMEDFENEK